MPNYKDFDLDIQNKKGSFANGTPKFTKGYTCYPDGISECVCSPSRHRDCPTQGNGSCRNTVCDM